MGEQTAEAESSILIHGKCVGCNSSYECKREVAKHERGVKVARGDSRVQLYLLAS